MNQNDLVNKLDAIIKDDLARILAVAYMDTTKTATRNALDAIAKQNGIDIAETLRSSDMADLVAETYYNKFKLPDSPELEKHSASFAANRIVTDYGTFYVCNDGTGHWKVEA